MTAGDADRVRRRRLSASRRAPEGCHRGAAGDPVPALLECDARRARPVSRPRRSIGAMDGTWDAAQVLVTGGSGFLGRVVVGQARRRGAVRRAPAQPSTTSPIAPAAERLFAEHRPDLSFHLAARVGGIGYNQERRADLYLDNLLMGTYVIEAARTQRASAKTVLVGTVCSYPKFTPVPFREESLWDGYPEETNAPYGIAKKAHARPRPGQRAQYGQRSPTSSPPTSTVPATSSIPSVSHVIPALIKKCVEAKERGDDKVEVWGTGTASREYLYVDDAAEGIVLAAEHYDDAEPVNLGTDHEVTIRETVETIARLVGFTGELRWDPPSPTASRAARVDADARRAAARLAGADAASRTACGARSTGTSIHREPRPTPAPRRSLGVGLGGACTKPRERLVEVGEQGQPARAGRRCRARSWPDAAPGGAARARRWRSGATTRRVVPGRGDHRLRELEPADGALVGDVDAGRGGGRRRAGAASGRGRR